MPKKTLTPDEIVRSHEADVQKSLDKHGLQPVMVVNFPGKKKAPLIGRLGVWLVNKTGGTIALKYAIINSNIAKK